MTENFQQRIFSKIRESIGDLMTDEDLKRLVEAGIQKAFFEEHRDTYGRIDRPSELSVLLKELLDKRVIEAVQTWLKENPDAVSRAINDALAKGMLGLIQNYLDNQMRWPLQELANKLQQAGVLR